MALIDYNLEKVYTKTLELENLGSCAIRATSEEEGTDYYLCVQSVAGFAYILKYGPIIPDLEPGSLEAFSLDYKKIKYSTKSLNIEINKFINDPMKKVNMAEEITVEEALQNIPTSDAFVPA